MTNQEQDHFQIVGFGIKPKDLVAQAMVNLILREAYPDHPDQYPLLDCDLKLCRHTLSFPDELSRDFSYQVLKAKYGNTDDALYKQALLLAAMGA